MLSRRQQQRPLPQALPEGLAELVCAKEQEFEDQAKAAFAAAGSGVPGDLLRPLKLLVLAERGGPVLQVRTSSHGRRMSCCMRKSLPSP